MMLSTRIPYLAIGVLFLMGSADLARADVIVMKATSELRGVFQGDNTRTGQEDTITLLGFAMGVDTQRALIEGTQVLVGERLFQPVTISKLVDKTTPQFFEALFTDENLVEVQISFYRPTRDSRGKEELYYTLTLSDAKVSNISQDRPSGEHATVETISLVFEMLSVMSEETGQEAMGVINAHCKRLSSMLFLLEYLYECISGFGNLTGDDPVAKQVDLNAGPFFKCGFHGSSSVG